MLHNWIVDCHDCKSDWQPLNLHSMVQIKIFTFKHGFLQWSAFPASLQVNHLNMAWDILNTTVVSPIYFALFTLFTILAGAIMSKDYSGQSMSSCIRAMWFHH